MLVATQMKNGKGRVGSEVWRWHAMTVHNGGRRAHMCPQCHVFSHGKSQSVSAFHELWYTREVLSPRAVATMGGGSVMPKGSMSGSKSRQARAHAVASPAAAAKKYNACAARWSCLVWRLRRTASRRAHHALQKRVMPPARAPAS